MTEQNENLTVSASSSDLMVLDDPTDLARRVEQGLGGYVAAVAAVLGVSEEATYFEVSDTATAYLGLTNRCARWPGRDLMLVWNERYGWSVAVETDPGETDAVLAYLGGTELVPSPGTVARFAALVVAGDWPKWPRPALPTSTVDRHILAERLRNHDDGGAGLNVVQ